MSIVCRQRRVGINQHQKLDDCSLVFIQTLSRGWERCPWLLRKGGHCLADLSSLTWFWQTKLRWAEFFQTFRWFSVLLFVR